MILDSSAIAAVVFEEPQYETILDTSWAVDKRVVPGLERIRGERLMHFHPRKGPQEIEIPKARTGGHGGSDPALREDFFGRPWNAARPARMASLDEAMQAILVGAAANASIASGGEEVRVQELLNGQA